jgi:tetratricopeptide (TPR) repeat protein
MNAIRTDHQAELQLAHRMGQEGNFAESERIYKDYLQKAPDDAAVNFNVGVLIQQRANCPDDRFEAAEFYERVIKSSNADMELRASSLNNIGILMSKVDQPEKAAKCFNLALQLDPLHVEARINYAESLRFNCQWREAKDQFDTILEIEPGSPSARFNRGMLGVMCGDLKQGFEDYEYRFDVKAFPTARFVSDKPLWQGESLHGKTILLTTEQGFGDAIQFIRYAAELKQRWNCQVWFYGHTLLMELFKGVTGLDRAFDQSDVEDFDFHVPIMSLPHRLGTTLETIPANVPYIQPTGWTPYYIPPSDKRKVGLVWAGSPRHGKDAYRSIEPEQYQSIIDAHPECQFYTLQVGPRCMEAARLTNVICLEPHILGWEYTAQALQQLDLLITVDTACAHLAGALARPVWMLCPESPDFRWMLERETSPWYPTMRIFRQPSRNSWQPVLDRIKNEL